MQKTIEVLRTMERQDIINGLNEFIDKNHCALALSKECRDYLAEIGIYGPYTKLGYEIL